MAKISTLKDLEGNRVYPRTVAKAVEGLPISGMSNNIFTGSDLPPTYQVDCESTFGEEVNVGDFYIQNQDRVFMVEKIDSALSRNYVHWHEVEMKDTILGSIDVTATIQSGGIDTSEYSTLRIDDSWKSSFQSAPGLYIIPYDYDGQELDWICVYDSTHSIDIKSVDVSDYATIKFFFGYQGGTVITIKYSLSNDPVTGGTLLDYVKKREEDGELAATSLEETSRIDVSKYSMVHVSKWKEPSWPNTSLILYGYKNNTRIKYIPMHTSPVDINVNDVDISEFDEISFFIGTSSTTPSPTTIEYTLSDEIIGQKKLSEELVDYVKKEDAVTGDEWELIYFNQLSEATALVVPDIVLGNNYRKLKIEVIGACSSAGGNMCVYRNSTSTITTLFGNVVRTAETHYNLEIKNEACLHKNGYIVPTSVEFRNEPTSTSIDTYQGLAQQGHGVQSYNTLRVTSSTGQFNVGTSIAVYGVKKKDNIEILIQPNDIELSSGDTKDIYCMVAGNTDGSTNTTYQWQMSSNGGQTWSNSTATGNTSWKLSVSYGSGNERLYRCKITDKDGIIAYTNVAKCTIAS